MSWKIGGLFGRSPYGPAHEHMTKVHECVKLFGELIRSAAAGNPDDVKRLAADIHRIEHEADGVKTEIRNRLSASVFSAPQRTEIIRLLRSQDDVADRIEDAAGMLELRQTPLPEELQALLGKLTERTVSGCDVIMTVEGQLAAAAEASPEENVPAVARHALEQYYALAHETSVASREALARLFALEKSLDPVSVIFLMQVISLLNSASDALENTADVLIRLIGQ